MVGFEDGLLASFITFFLWEVLVLPTFLVVVCSVKTLWLNNFIYNVYQNALSNLSFGRNLSFCTYIII